MRSPYSPLHLLLFIVVIGFLMAFVQVGVLNLAFDKLGLAPGAGFLLLFASLFGSAVNLPLFTLKTAPPAGDYRLPWQLRGLLRVPQRPFAGRTTIAINVGGGLIPVFFSLYLLRHNPLGPSQVIVATAIVAIVSYLVSRPVPGLGIGMPIFVAPISAALAAVLIDPRQSAPLAYICGTLGVLIGADLLRLKDIRSMGTPLASIGGAGTFDGIFITGIVAVLLA